MDENISKHISRFCKFSDTESVKRKQKQEKSKTKRNLLRLQHNHFSSKSNKIGTNFGYVTKSLTLCLEPAVWILTLTYFRMKISPKR